MRASAPTGLLLSLVATALLLPCASAAPVDVAPLDVDAEAQAGLAVTGPPSETSTTLDGLAGIPGAGPLPLPLPAVDLQLPAVDVEVQAAADVGVPPTGPTAPSHLHPSSASDASDVALQLATDAAPVALTAVGLAIAGYALRLLLSLLPAGLFSRIERGQLLDNPVRARVHDAVASEPGVTLSEVQSRAGIAWGTTVHHLRRLEANGLVVSVSQRAHRRYFLANTPAAAQRTALAAILHPTARRIAALVVGQPGIDHSSLCAALGLNSPAASKHLEQFRAQGLVTSLRDGKRTLHHPTPGLHLALGALEGPAPSSLVASCGPAPVDSHGPGPAIAAYATSLGGPHMSAPRAALSSVPA